MGQYYRVIILRNKEDKDKQNDCENNDTTLVSEVTTKDTTDNDDENILTWLSPYKYNSGAKLMEHSYTIDDMINTVEYLISPIGKYYKSCIVWAGDYAEPECFSNQNLYMMVDYRSDIETTNSYKPECDYRYIVNHTQKSYVDKENPLNKIINEWDFIIHPLSILLAESGSGGGGDYRGNNEHLCGSWARNSISVETTIPDGFNELVPNFYE